MIPSIAHKEELPLDTLDLQELILQWKVMKAMGYKSLFDPDFRRELRNPLRKLMYYTIVVEEEQQERMFFVKQLDSASDKIGYFSDPDLYQKFKEAENRSKALENQGNNKYMARMRDKGKAMEAAYRKSTKEERAQALEILKR